MVGLLYLPFLIMTYCGHAAGDISTVRVQPGVSTSLECHIQLEGSFNVFWIKFPLNKAPVCIATVKTFADDAAMCEQFENHSRIKVTWNKKNFNLTFSSVEQADVAIYFCGTYNYGQHFFGNGSELILEEHVDVSSNINEKKQVFEYLVPALTVTNVASIFLIIWFLLKKNRSGVTGESKDASDKTDEVNYGALTFHDKKRRTVEKRTPRGHHVDTTVIYGAVRHQEEL
ncbi:uncharacterized protein LOC108436117 isoform X2 [Pygocentrus nattereri]|uniref:uncharacterized protein LOC108436117 isoform X2 n=1 Tax=Pygocentrus nattereri TaxID=42514 RepID=UPI00189172D4|nr:uncharacterized protein LOC108436117 isoform X2 [Pygocentrus nattereri]